ncbi:cobalt-precorrin-5B (C(1))-methyltransferase [Glycomyces sp. TRM65418]|uniref:cobalt-precorrin-5B (C(1))-methyltransferase n=1 Tax=Glycomyces sp. TRM65418 TaxID=2867006 RepID=UPI0035AC186B
MIEPDLPRTAKARAGKALRTGFTTGACATAAAKAAILLLATGKRSRTVDVWLPVGRRVEFTVDRCEHVGEAAEAVVVKDAGDDPDVTNGAHLTATVAWSDEPGVHLYGGDGVGVVTRPGLGLEVGGPAINGTPRQMIRITVEEVCDPYAGRGVDVVVSVPEGERMAKRTTNARLGILGGISILGTTGIVRPFSTAAWRASVLQAVDVMAAAGRDTCVLTTGGRTERAAIRLLPGLDEVCFTEVGDFTGAAVERCVQAGLTRLVFVGMAGKLAKLGAGVMMTHYTKSKVDTGYLAEVTARAGGTAALVAEVDAANTGRHAYELWSREGLLAAAGDTLCDDVAANLAAWARHCGGELDVDAVLVDFGDLEPVAWNSRAPDRLARAGADPERWRRP